MLNFKNKVLMIGYGAVARSVLPLFLKHVKVPYKNITVIDFLDKRKELKPWIDKGVRFCRERIDPINLSKVLSRHVSTGGLIIDLAWNIDCLDILRWAHDNNVLYVNASVEEWDPYSEIHTKSSLEKSLYYRYMKLFDMAKGWTHRITAVVDHGANPGLVSHFAKQGLVDIARRAIEEKKIPRRDARVLERLMKENQFGPLAMKLGVKVIHCSERDTQITSRPKGIDEFVGMWSVEGMREESMSPVEVGWGTHEKTLPKNAIIPNYGTRNQIIMSQMGINTLVRSWVPCQEFVGMIITHGEAFGISHHFTVRRGKRVVYRPTVHYAYLPSNETMSSLHELRCRGYELQPHTRIMYDEIAKGTDMLGALIMGHCYNSWWIGSMLSIEQARRLVPHQNATTIQVAIGVVAALVWMLEHPEEGLCFPEDLPHEDILAVARPYLGTFHSEPSDWTPLKNYQVFFKENPETQPDTKDVWQFKNFLFKP